MYAILMVVFEIKHVVFSKA